MVDSPAVIPDPFAHRPRRAWRRAVVEAPPALAAAAADLLVEVSGAGVEVAAAPDGERERIVAYLPGGEAAAAAESALRAGLATLEGRVPGCGTIGLRVDDLLEEDWGGAWKEHFRPFSPAPGLVVKPSWEPYEAKGGEAVVEMDPGMAFGTGLHASTRLALALISARLAAGGVRRALDVGTGTGLLAMSAALLGAPEVVAIDNDPDAVAAARGNVERNGLAGAVSVGGEDLAAIDGAFDLVAANITADVLTALAAPLVRRLAPGGTLVLSGILAGEQAAGVRTEFERLGLSAGEERTEGEWAALALEAAAEEVFELVDGEGRVIGRAPRRECHANPALVHRAAHVVVLDGRGRFYLQKRALNKDIQPGRWDTSVGGHLDIGEDHLAGARREMREELGLSGELRFLYRYLWCTDRETELVETFLHVATAEPRPLPAEVDEGRWLSRPEVDALVRTGACTPNLEEELRRLAAAGVF